MDIASTISDLIAKIVLYLGGGAVIVFALSSWLGKVWANRILEKDKVKYKKEFEKIKNVYDQELEKYKDQLERAKANHLRYSEFQFKLYNDLWGSLVGLRLTADNLWKVAHISNVHAFEQQLRITKKIVEKNRLLIEEKHYEQLFGIFTKFGNFRIGKMLLLDLREQLLTDNNYQLHLDIETAVKENGEIKEEFDLILDRLAKAFRKQIAE